MNENTSLTNEKLNEIPQYTQQIGAMRVECE